MMGSYLDVLPPKATVQWSTLTIPFEVLKLAALHMCITGRLPRWLLPRSAEHLDTVNPFTAVVCGLDFAKCGELYLVTPQRWRYRKACACGIIRETVGELVGLQL